MDPVLESQCCISQNPPPPENQLIFLGRYRQIAGPPGIFQTCRRARRRPRRYAASSHRAGQRPKPDSVAGDFFSIKLSNSIVLSSSSTLTVLYARAGYLAGGNVTVR